MQEKPDTFAVHNDRMCRYQRWGNVEKDDVQGMLSNHSQDRQ